MQGTKMPYVKPSLESVDASALTEAVGPVQALASAAGPSNSITPPTEGAVRSNRLNRR